MWKGFESETVLTGDRDNVSRDWGLGKRGLGLGRRGGLGGKGGLGVGSRGELSEGVGVRVESMTESWGAAIAQSSDLKCGWTEGSPGVVVVGGVVTRGGVD